MKSNRRLLVSLIGACGLAGGLASTAGAQPFVINLAGATLQQNLLTAPASTNEFLEINGVPGSQQLAPAGLPAVTGGAYASNQYWIVQYRATNSGAGLTELVNYGRTFVTNGDDVSYCPSAPPTPFGAPLAARLASGCWVNTVAYVTNGCPAGSFFNTNHAGGAPVRSVIDPEQCNNNTPFSSNHQAAPYARFPDTSPNSGLQIDIAPLDVPLDWLLAQNGVASPVRLPNAGGYGSNPRVALNPDGTVYADGSGRNETYTLVSLGTANTNYAAPNCDTVYSTPIAFAPVAVLTNYGTGLTQITKSNLRHLAATGRTQSGENLTVITREALSGTRNSAMSSIGLDPSFGVGENVGQQHNNANQGSIGPSYLPSNKIGSGDMERAVINTRLAIGYTGAERGATGSGFTGAWLTTGKIEVLGVKDDLNGGTDYARPTINNILDNGLIGQTDPTSGTPYAHDGYRIGAISSWNTIGDPRNQNELGGDANNTNPRMRNTQAANYMNNVTRSIEAFDTDPGNNQNAFKPGEYLAFNGFVPPPAIDFKPVVGAPSTYTSNSAPQFTFLQEFVRSHSVLRFAEYATYGTGSLNNGGQLAGTLPTRQTGVTYSDGVSGSSTNYVDQGGTSRPYASQAKLRNRVAGDFNGDGRRDINDISDMIAAWRQRNGGPAWVAPAGSGDLLALATANGLPAPTSNDAIIEVLGDFNNDGNFGRVFNASTSQYVADTSDVRYFADGLAIDPSTGRINRRAGFLAVDTASAAQGLGSNFFGTVLATGVAYQAGASVADVSSASGRHTPGYAPIGQDGRVDGFDIDYVYSQFKRNPNVTDGELNWDNLAEAVGADLSADINGDLKINQADVCYIVFNVLRTSYGDVNLDGVVDASDLSIAQANIGHAGGWAQGDMDGDGNVTPADILIIQRHSNLCCPCDWSGDGQVNSQDFFNFVTDFFAVNADFNRDGQTNSQDFFDFLSCFFTLPGGCLQ